MNQVEKLELYRKVIRDFNSPELEQESGAAEIDLNGLPEEALTEDTPTSTPASESSDSSAAPSGALHSLIRQMSIPQKIKLALFGNQTARAILLRDSNRQVSTTVLQNPKLTPAEVQEMARNTQVDESIIRTISNNSEWMKAYPLKLGIVTNPKCPIDVALRWLKYLQEKDLRKIAKSKNVPQVIAAQARKLVEQKG